MRAISSGSFVAQVRAEWEQMAPGMKKGAQLSLKPLDVIDAPCVIRTHDRLLRRQLLYPAELREHRVILTARAERYG